jgi:hypothetical protein
MGFLYEMFWLASQAASGLSYKWLVTYVLVVLVCGALLWDLSTHRLKFGRKMLLLLLPFLGVVLLLFVGSLFQGRPAFVFVPFIALAICVILATVAVAKLRPAWMSSITVSLAILWYGYWCSFVSFMSITGDWL